MMKELSTILEMEGCKVGVADHACSPNTWMVEAERSVKPIC
jgi:hypothetical protein